MTSKLIVTTIFEGVDDLGHVYRVQETSNPDWTPRCEPIYKVERNQGDHDPRFFSIYVGENKYRALELAGAI